jgi:hypothetical protein
MKINEHNRILSEYLCSFLEIFIGIGARVRLSHPTTDKFSAG